LVAAGGLELVHVRGWGGPVGLAYERWVMPKVVRGLERPTRLGRLAAQSGLGALARLAFRVEERIDLGEGACGWLALARAAS
jgi:hypothetical protein